MRIRILAALIAAPALAAPNPAPVIEADLALGSVHVHAKVAGTADRRREEAVARVDEVPVHTQPLVGGPTQPGLLVAVEV